RVSGSVGVRLAYYIPSYCKSLIVNGILESTGQSYICGQTVTINGRLLLKGYAAVSSYPNGSGFSEFEYGPGSAVEYAYPYGMTIGDEVNRSTAPANSIDTIVVNQNTAGDYNVTLTNDTAWVNNIRFVGGKLLISVGRIVFPQNPIITNASPARFIATVGGDVKANDVGSDAVFLPIGPSLTEYNPVTIVNDGTVDHFTVKALPNRPPCLASYPLTSVNYQWDINEASTGGSDVTLTLGYSDITKRGSMYVPANSEIVHCAGNNANYHSGGGETATTPYSVTGSGFNEFSLFAITSDNTVLPLTFMKSFTAEIQKTDVVLRWSVNCTSQKVKMELQNAIGNTNSFTTIYTVEADANRCKQPFEYTHAQAAANDNYYRIKITDIDGSVSYSGILHVVGNSKGMIITVKPNPVHGSVVYLNVNADLSATLTLSFSDAQGKVVKTENRVISQGTNILEINISSLQQGIYFIKSSDEGKVISTIKMVKQ
ncbi:MAG: T9SS type A sorting domain-containing protein, partial [Parafilimonas sp.]